MTDLSAQFKALGQYRPVNKVRFVTAASLFDGHDAAINIMRRILQGMGTEVIHLGHNRSVEEVVTAALQEDARLAGQRGVPGVVEDGHLGAGLLYYTLAYTHRAQTAVCIGSGGGFVIPRPPVGACRLDRVDARRCALLLGGARGSGWRGRE